jgi:hypothetical protein
MLTRGKTDRNPEIVRNKIPVRLLAGDPEPWLTPPNLVSFQGHPHSPTGLPADRYPSPLPENKNPGVWPKPDPGGVNPGSP